MNSIRTGITLAGLALILGVVPPLGAQSYYNPISGRPNYPTPVPAAPVAPWGYGYPYWTPGSYWSGKADAIRATGDLQLQAEEGRVMREKWKQEKYETRKTAIDYINYENANLPTFTDNQIRVQQTKVRAALNNPPTHEITSGRALNTLLPYLSSLMVSGAHGPNMKLDRYLLTSVNVTTGNSGNIGPLKNGGKIDDWPTGLRGPLQETLDGLLVEACQQAIKGRVDSAMRKKLNQTTDQLEETLRKRFHKDEIDSREYLDGKHLIDDLREAYRVLSLPNAKDFLNGTYAAEGDSVEELLYKMNAKGLSFAPAMPGQDGPYIALHRAFVAYAQTGGDTGFRVRLGVSAQQQSKSSSK
jgi:hypothetical protein